MCVMGEIVVAACSAFVWLDLYCVKQVSSVSFANDNQNGSNRELLRHVILLKT